METRNIFISKIRPLGYPSDDFTIRPTTKQASKRKSGSATFYPLPTTLISAFTYVRPLAPERTWGERHEFRPLFRVSIQRPSEHTETARSFIPAVLSSTRRNPPFVPASLRKGTSGSLGPRMSGKRGEFNNSSSTRLSGAR